MASEEIITKFRDFIEKYYYTDLLNAIRKGKNSINIDFSILSKFDITLSDQLLEKFSEIIESAEEAIKQFDIPEAKYPIHLRFFNLPKSAYLKIRNIRSENLSKLISTEGLIRQASDVRPRILLATFECPKCGAQIVVKQMGKKLKRPTRCSCGRKSNFKQIDKKMVDVQRLIIEESPENLEGGEQPKRINVFLEEDLLDPELEKRRYPGNKIKVVGVIKEVAVSLRSGGQSTTYDLLIEANNVETVDEEFEEIKLSPKDKKVIKELSMKKNIYDLLKRSIAPSIYGHENIKEAIVLQLFGGIRKKREDGTRTRGDIHIFLVGDPGSGKSQILRYVSSLSPKARYVAGKGATTAGLTASVVKDEFLKGWSLEAGALVLANKGVACLDELDKMSSEDTGAMHEALEQQTITIAKANIQATLRAETSVLAAANPKFGRFDPYSLISKQIDLPPTLINRFDLIFPIRDIPNIELDEKIATHVLELAKDSSAQKAEIEPSLLRKYIAYAKQNCFPKITAGAIREIKKFYVDLRSAAALEEGEVKSIPISARQLEALVRMAEASAKIRLDNKVTKKDAKKAIKLLRSCMEAVALDAETGKFDIDRITTGITATQRSKISILKRIIDMLTDKVGKSIPISDILNEADNEGIDKAKAEEILDNLKKKGDIFEPKPGLVQKIG
ncbi:AAA domain-containing protein [Candidatus Woesearchaeota archaeon]|nr:AAA domain-containing protein [Candidatus Woesearchaeota archaeon]